MSTESTTTYIPGEDEVATPSTSRKGYRFADGKILTGRAAEGTLEEKEKVVGALRRIGIHWGVKKNATNTPYGQIEADWETAGGMLRLKASISDSDGLLAPSTPALGYAEGLLQLAAGEIAVITATQSTKLNKYGKLVTYANVFHYDVATKRTRETNRRQPTEAEKAQPLSKRWEDLEAQLKLHPAYADRPASDTDDEEDGTAGSHLSALCKECKEKTWPTPEEAPKEWLEMMGAYFEKPAKTALSQHDDDDWGELRQELKDRAANNMPKMLVAAKERLAKASETADPFADSNKKKALD